MLNYVVKFEYKNVPDIEVVKIAMREELVRVYNEFCSITNGGLVDQLNKDFDEKYPNYKIADNLWESVEYVDHFRGAYSKIVDDFNRRNVSKLLDFYIGDELELIGRLKVLNKTGTVSFYLVPEES